MAPVRDERGTNWLGENGGIGLGRLQIDFPITALETTPSTSYRAFVPTGDFYSPDL